MTGTNQTERTHTERLAEATERLVVDSSITYYGQCQVRGNADFATRTAYLDALARVQADSRQPLLVEVRIHVARSQ